MSLKQVAYLSLSDAAEKLAELEQPSVPSRAEFEAENAKFFRAANNAARDVGAVEGWEDSADARWLDLPEVQKVKRLVDEYRELESKAADEAVLQCVTAMGDIIREGTANRIAVYGYRKPRMDRDQQTPDKIEPIGLIDLKPQGYGRSILTSQKGDPIWYDVKVDWLELAYLVERRARAATGAAAPGTGSAISLLASELQKRDLTREEAFAFVTKNGFSPSKRGFLLGIWRAAHKKVGKTPMAGRKKKIEAP